MSLPARLARGSELAAEREGAADVAGGCGGRTRGSTHEGRARSGRSEINPATHAAAHPSRATNAAASSLLWNSGDIPGVAKKVVERDAPRAVVEVQKRERRYNAHAQLITSRSPINAFCVTFKKREVPRSPSIK